MVKHNINTIPLLTLKTSSVIHRAKYTEFYFKKSTYMISYNL